MQLFRESTRLGEGGKPLLLLDISIWMNLVKPTGYTLGMLIEPLYELCTFIRQNLKPDRLEGFDIEAIKELNESDVIMNPIS